MPNKRRLSDIKRLITDSQRVITDAPNTQDAAHKALVERGSGRERGRDQDGAAAQSLAGGDDDNNVNNNKHILFP